MILFRRQNKSGKSSAESEGSPDEVLIWNFVIETCLCLNSNSELFKTKNISTTFEGGRQWQEKARSADGQLAATEVFFQLLTVSHIFFLLQVPLQLCGGEGEEADGKHQEGESEEVERFRKPDRLPFLSTVHVDKKDAHYAYFAFLLHRDI